jgi:hypothetical protein
MIEASRSLLKSLVLCTAAATAITTTAGADWGFTLGKKGQHGAFALHLSSGHPAHRPACASAPCRVWVPGHYAQREKKVWVEGRRTRVWIEPLYEIRRDACGRPIEVCVAPGHYADVFEPGHYETRTVRVWRPGHWRIGPAC